MKLIGKVSRDSLAGESAPSPHKLPSLWIVVADRNVAKIFRKEKGKLEQIGEAAPEVTANRRGTPDKSLGRVAGSVGDGVRHKLEPSVAPGQSDDLSFVQDISAWLDKAAQDNAFDTLILAASPKMLGDLRKKLSVRVQGLITVEINKDLTKMDPRTLEEELENIA